MDLPSASALLDLPPFPSNGYAQLADRIGAILGTRNDVLLVQGEAIVALEAVATSLAKPGLSAINIVTSPYGAMFGGWLRRGGASVADVAADAGLPIRIEAVREALDANSDARLLAIVHAESATGILNPLEEIMALAHERGLVTVVDAVASVGGHPLDVDALGIDVAVIGPQKSLGGSAGLSAMSVSSAAWALADHGGRVLTSILSLLDHRSLWLDKGRGMLPGMPSALEFWAFQAALDRVDAEGMDAVIARHHQAAAATRAGIQALGAALWVGSEHASALVTAVHLPDNLNASQVIALAGAASGLSAGVGAVGDRLVRLNHTGSNANLAPVRANLAALAAILGKLGLNVDPEAADRAILAIYGLSA